MTAALPSAAGPVHGEVVVPGSKSETNRALVLAALATGVSTLRGALRSRDSDLMVAALRTLGADIDWTGPSELRITPGPIRGGGSVDCGLAGTVMRFVPPLVLLADAPVSFTGDPHASERPMAGLLDALRALGARIDGDRLPFTISPSAPAGGRVEVDASASSQFVSGLLLVGARLPGGLVVEHVGERLPSRPHIAMTTAMLTRHGIRARELDDHTWQVDEGCPTPVDARVEPDLTNASAFLAAAAVAGGSVSVPGWPEATTQPGALSLDIFKAMGCEVTVADGIATVLGDGRLTAAGVLDLHEASELTPVVAALAAVAEGTTTITGVAHIRGHETDRLSALARELARAGIVVEERPDGLVIVGGRPRAATFETYADHRMVHFAALLGLLAPGSSVTDMACVGKTMPDFPALWAGLL